MAVAAIKSRRDEHTEATRRALLVAGRHAFASAGFAGAGIEGIARDARVTRGAFYHHFEDKLELFDAVVVELQADAAQQVSRRARTVPGLRDRLFTGIHAYLKVCRDPDYLRIVILEAPAALGQARFAAIEEAYPMALLAATLQALQDRGEIDFPDIGFVTRAVDAIICKLALLMDGTDDRAALQANGDLVIANLLRL
jgi:AcrR family transcriptional regulator